jgi:putative nucleotidyltransferase with HDIG domain
MMAKKLTNTLKVTYCRIALIDEGSPDPIIRAAYPIRMINWEPGIGRVLQPYALPDIRRALETSQHVVLSGEAILKAKDTLELSQILTPQTQSALILPLNLKAKVEGIIILGEARIWEREPFSPEKISLCQTLVNQATIAIANAKSHANLQEMFMSTITAMGSAIDAKSPWTRGHSERMTDIAVKIGKTLGLDQTSLNHLRLGCLLHDIGKIGTYEAILNKPGRLTDEEMTIMKQHPSRGEEILKPIRQFRDILAIVRHHHERFDGQGYPDGLVGEHIPLLARIAAIADTYDAMTADRPYRKGCTQKEAINEIKRHAGTQFDPNIAKIFVNLLENIC